MLTDLIYLDYNATYPLCASARQVVVEHCSSDALVANPSSTHEPGQRARYLLEEAREELLRLSGLEDYLLVFTSGGTESNQVALRYFQTLRPGKRLLLGEIEHPSLPAAARQLRIDTTVLPIDANGFYRLDRLLENAPNVAGLSLHAANNELGTLQDIDQFRKATSGELCFHTDATQYWLRAALTLEQVAVDFITVSGHKLGALPGIGGLFIHRRLLPLFNVRSSSQEYGLRPGTENLLGALTMAAAARERAQNFKYDFRHMSNLRDRLESLLLEGLPGVVINNATDARLPNTSNIRLPAADGRALLVALQLAGLALSPGSACASGAAEPSPVLQATGCTREEALQSVRISLGPETTQEHVDEAVKRIMNVVKRQHR